MSMLSLMLEPLKSIVSRPSCPSSVSLPSPGFHWKTSSSVPIRARSSPLSPKVKSAPAPPRNTSAPCEPRSESSSAPPSTVSLTTPAGSVVAVTPSLPPSVLITRASLAPSLPVMFTRGVRPSTETDVPAPTTSTTSLPFVPLTMIVSARPSPTVPPAVAARSASTEVTSVRERSSTVRVSLPPSARTSMFSTSAVSVTMLPRLRVNRTRLPLAKAAKISSPAEPLKTSSSLPS